MQKAYRYARVHVIAVMILLLIAGCGAAPQKSGDAPSSAKSGETGSAGNNNELRWDKVDDPALKNEPVTILVTDTDGSVAKLLNKFTDDTGIPLKVVGVDYNSLYNKITTAAISNSSDIDLVEMDTIWAGQLLKGNMVEDLTDVVPKDYQNQFTASSLASVKFGERLTAMPYYSSSKHFYWNIELLKKAGYDAPPKTWDEFRDMSKKLKKEGVYASGWSWKQAEDLNCDFVAMVHAFGGTFFDKQGNFNVNSPESVKALQYMTDLIQTDKTVDPASLQWASSDVQQAFEAGRIAMMSNWEGMYPELNDAKKSKVVNQTDVGLLPGEGNVVSAAVTGSEGIAIMKSSKHKQASLAFLKWMSSKNFQQSNFLDKGTYPALQSLYTDAEVKKADTTNTIDKIVAQFDYGVNRPNGPGYVEWSDILAGEVFAALTGQQTPQAALDAAASKIGEAIKKAE
jgi:multiple sugar transport system substrate-binding protein